MASGTSRGVQSVDRAFAILDYIRANDSAGVTEIHEELDIAVGTAHAYLATLEENDVLVNSNGTYRLGLGSLKYGGAVRNRSEFYQYARESLRELAEETGEFVAASVEEHGEIVYLEVEKGYQAPNIGVEVGTRRPMYCTGSGKAILAVLTDDRVAEILESTTFEPVTQNTVTAADELRAELRTVREQGFAYDDEEWIDGMRSVASVVVNDNTDEVKGAIAVAGPRTRIKGELFTADLPELVSDTAREVSVNLTYS